MKQLSYLLILISSFTFVFSQDRPCCKNKVGNGKVACKLNQSNVDINNNSISKSAIKSAENLQYNDGSNTNIVENKNCNGCKKNTKWWKFWVKKTDCCNT